MRGPVFVDEVQRAPGLLLAIKRAVDRNATPGHFLLTGSANLLTAHKVKVPRLLRLLASQATNIVSQYIGLLQTVFLVHLLPAWRPGIGAREVHAPKAYLVDAGLLAHLLGADERRIEADDQVTGKVLENLSSPRCSSMPIGPPPTAPPTTIASVRKRWTSCSRAVAETSSRSRSRRLHLAIDGTCAPWRSCGTRRVRGSRRG